MRRFVRLYPFLTSFLIALLFVLGSAVATPVRAQISSDTSAAMIPASQLLNPDGTLNLQNGVSGSVNLTDWQVSLDPLRGPVLAPNARTTSESGLGYGVDFLTNAIAVTGSDVYVGGSFAYICDNAACKSGNLTVNGIAKWSEATHSWSALANGLVGNVKAIAVIGNDVYVGGDFRGFCGNAECISGNVNANFIAKWNGSSWSSLGNGMNNWVYALAVSGGNLYVGGNFVNACGDPTCLNNNLVVNHVARWSPTTSSWSSLQSGLNNNVAVLTANGTNIYAGGDFRQVCGDPACDYTTVQTNAIARYSTVSNSWSAVGFGLNYPVKAIAVSGNKVYAGGYFEKTCGDASCASGGTVVHHVAQWNGNSWSAMGSGVDSYVLSLAAIGTHVLIGGIFSVACGNPDCNSNNLQLNHFADWNGSSLSAFENGANWSVLTLWVGANTLYAGGGFTQLCGNITCDSNDVTVNHVAEYAVNFPTPTPSPTQTPTPRATPKSNCGAKPAKPLLKVPANNTQLHTTTPTLKWERTNCAKTYSITIKKASNGKKADRATGLTALQYTPKKLKNGKTYTWSVQACDAKGCTASATRTFTIKTH